MRIALIGDAQSPHLLKWARALAADPGVELWVLSSRGFDAGFDGLVAAQRRLALATTPRVEGGNAALLLQLPRLGAWLARVDADWLHAHYLSSHGTLAWLAKRLWRLRGRIVASAWGSDILVAPRSSRLMRALTRRVLAASALCTSDSAHMAQCMRELGAREVLTFPFGLDALPAEPGAKQPWHFFANRALEPGYRPQRVLEVFASVAAREPDATLVVANKGSLAGALRERSRALGLGERVRFVGRLASDEQAREYRRAQWYLSLPESDSVSVSMLEAMAHGCIAIASDLPANRELVRDRVNGLILRAGEEPDGAALRALLDAAPSIAQANRAWVAQHALFAPAVARFLARLRELGPA